jgi:acyl-CoA thioester hydrolase
VRFAETDAMGIVHHSNYRCISKRPGWSTCGRWGGRTPSCASRGRRPRGARGVRAVPPPVAFDDEVACTWCSPATRASFQIAYLLTVDDQVRATAVTVHGCVNAAGRPVRMPAWLLALGE